MKNYFVSLVGEKDTESLIVCVEALNEKLADLKKIGFEIKLVTQNDNVAIIQADDMAIVSLQDEWFVASINEDIQFQPM